MFEMRIIIQLLALLLFSTTVYAQSTALFPAMDRKASSIYPWPSIRPASPTTAVFLARTTQCGQH